ncbi:hypothetical protein FOZ63_031467 [Perkinsus olseni]|nr:hypothetical protein FOZ63_031467 [Perkinsus olseni]
MPTVVTTEGNSIETTTAGSSTSRRDTPVDFTAAFEEDGDPRVGASTAAPNIRSCGEHGVWSFAIDSCVCDDGWETVDSDPCSVFIATLPEDDGLGEMASTDTESGGKGGLVIAIMMLVIVIGVACFLLWRFYRTRGFSVPTLRLPSLTRPQKLTEGRLTEVSIP